MEVQLLEKGKSMRLIVGLVTAILLPVAIVVVAFSCAKAFIEEGIK
jgi:hypothetical protein